jgi:hypothetical protein
MSSLKPQLAIAISQNMVPFPSQKLITPRPLVATYAFQSSDAVNFYRTGYSICEGFICLSAVSCVAYGAACWWQNRQRENTPTDVGVNEYEKTEMGDMSPDYR